MKLNRRRIVSGLAALGIAISLQPAIAQQPRPRPTPPKPQPAPKPKPRPRPVTRQTPANPVRKTPRVNRVDKVGIKQGQRLLASSQRRAPNGAHPNKHAPIGRKQMRQKASNELKAIRAKQQQGKKLNTGERSALKYGKTFSSFSNNKFLHHSVGRATKHHAQTMRNMKIGETFRVEVPYKQNIGTIYNSRTKRYSQGKNAFLVFKKDKGGVYVHTAMVR